MNPPSPAIVAQDAVRRLPRWALLLLCVAYIVPGYVGRGPWKSEDIASFGYMLELAGANGWERWLQPALMGVRADTGALLPYWLGAWAMQAAPAWMAPDLAARIPFVLMLAGTLAAVWGAVAHLARHTGAQPVAFAFGGEADPQSYARALADGALLALIASLGLAQFSHETTPALAQLFFIALLFYALAALPFRRGAALTAVAGLIGLALSGAGGIALLIGALITGVLPRVRAGQIAGRRAAFIALLVATLVCALLAWHFNGWRWPIEPPLRWAAWRDRIKLLIWFTWPAWPLALWTLWRWRHQALSPSRNWHLSLPLMMAGVPLASAILGGPPDRCLLLALPGLAALAAFALPTFKRSGASFIDWFTVLFFTGWAIFIWVMWIAMQTGVPARPAANVARLAPGFVPVFQWAAFVAALLGTLAWIALARWRTGRHRAALWKSLVLPASGMTLCWLLVMTLWLPVLDYARGYAPQMRQLGRVIGQTSCVQVHGLSAPQLAAVRFHGGWTSAPAHGAVRCDWLLVDIDALPSLPAAVDMRQWQIAARVRRPTDNHETLLAYRRVASLDDR